MYHINVSDYAIKTMHYEINQKKMIYLLLYKHAFFSFYLFIVYLPECKQQLRTMKKYAQIYTINLGCRCITPREPCNYQRPRCDIEFVPRFSVLNCWTISCFAFYWIKKYKC